MTGKVGAGGAHSADFPGTLRTCGHRFPHCHLHGLHFLLFLFFSSLLSSSHHYFLHPGDSDCSVHWNFCSCIHRLLPLDHLSTLLLVVEVFELGVGVAVGVAEAGADTPAAVGESGVVAEVGVGVGVEAVVEVGTEAFGHV